MLLQPQEATASMAGSRLSNQSPGSHRGHIVAAPRLSHVQMPSKPEPHLWPPSRPERVWGSGYSPHLELTCIRPRPRPPAIINQLHDPAPGCPDIGMTSGWAAHLAHLRLARLQYNVARPNFLPHRHRHLQLPCSATGVNAVPRRAVALAWTWRGCSVLVPAPTRQLHNCLHAPV